MLQLRPGYKLPPLMFSNEEALALVLGLLLVRQTGPAGTPADVEGALGKVERVMPDRLRGCALCRMRSCSPAHRATYGRRGRSSAR